MVIYKKEIKGLFYIFLTAHLIIWTAIPSLINNNLPLDTIEALAWGSNLDWGFNKHPPMSAFAVEIFYKIFGPQDWAYYLLSQIFVIISFFVVFKFAEDFFKSKILCFLSVLLLEGIYFYNFTTPEFNVNICLMPFWALSALYLWKGFKNNKIVDWLLFGLFTGFGFLSKYLFLYLGLAADIFIIYMIYKKKIDFKCIVSLIPFLIVLFPHLIWLTENDYVTIKYGFHRTGADDQNLLGHIINPLMFLGKQIGILIPFIIMFLFLIKKFKLKFKLNFNDKKLLFLLAINIIPIFLVFFTSLIMGVKIRTMWMSPFYLFFGVLIIYYFEKNINIKKLKNFFLIFLTLFIFSPFAYAYVSITETDKRTDYPGRKIAEEVKKIWLLNSAPDILSFVNYVGFDEWHAGNLSYNFKSRPKVIFNEDKISYYPHILLIYDSHRECPKTVWQLRDHKFFINEKRYMICY